MIVRWCSLPTVGRGKPQWRRLQSGLSAAICVAVLAFLV